MLRELKKRHIEQDGPVSLITVLSNPPAVESCRRYIDTDLNRCFTSQILRQVQIKPVRKHSWKEDTIHDKSVPAFQRPPGGRHALRDQAGARAQRSAGAQREPRGRGPAVRHSQHHLQHGSVPDLVLCRLDPSPHFKAHTGNHGAFAAFPPGWSHPHPWITPPADILSHTLHTPHILKKPNALGVVCSHLCISSKLWWPLGNRSRCGCESRRNPPRSKFGVFCFQSKMTSTPVRAIFVDVPASEGYSLESLGKHGFGERLASQLERVSGGCFLTVGGGPLTLQP